MPKTLIDVYIEKQQHLTAAQKFTDWHESSLPPLNKSHYQELIPKTAPREGQQYAFVVDLDKCTGCKACITACHNENGLEGDELWRDVGLLQGGTSEEPVYQHITSACHHCLDPACQSGCPVNAYEKDTATGIVKHLEDQCIGCQYCTFTCPYDVPKYNKKKGIVHKCDMCISRLKADEAPACVRGCPNGAIEIGVTDIEVVRRDPASFVAVPEAPDSSLTLPTTKYLRKKSFPNNMTAVDHNTLKIQHSHMPLVVMLVLTQLSVGAFVVDLFLKSLVADQLNQLLTTYRSLTAFGIGLLALGASVLHLGRPAYAFRAFIGFRRSWLSREIIAFGAFAFLASLYAWGKIFSLNVSTNAGLLTAVAGITGVFCSVMVYKKTKRPFWDHPATTFKFFLTTGILGTVTILLTSVIFTYLVARTAEVSLMRDFGNVLCVALWHMTALKLFIEGSVLTHLKDKENSSLKKTALLITGPLKRVWAGRLFFGFLGGIILPFLFLAGHEKLSWLNFIMSAAAIFIFTLIGELQERYLFFRAVVPLKI